MVFFLLPQKLSVRFKYDQKREREREREREIERETGHQHFLPGMSEIKGYFILFLSTKFEIPSPLMKKQTNKNNLPFFSNDV